MFEILHLSMKRGSDKKHFGFHLLTFELRNIPSSYDIKVGFNISNALQESIICDEHQPLSLTSIMSSSLLDSPVIRSDILVSASELMTGLVDKVYKMLEEPISTENQPITESKRNANETVHSMKEKEKTEKEKKMI